jgi:death-on-curing protein
MVRVDLEDLLLTAEAILDVPAEQLMRAADLGLAESALAAPDASYGGVDFYPGIADKAAVLAWHIVSNHPLPDGNKRAGLILMLDFLDRNGATWNAPSQDEIADAFLAIAAGEMSRDAFRDWVARHVVVPVADLRERAS